MAQGPFGIRRFTDVLPFSSDGVELDVEEEINDTPPRPPELERLLDDLNMVQAPVTQVTRKITVRQDPDDSAVDAVDRLKDTFARLGERFAFIRYYHSGDVGYIHKTEIDRRIQREGIGSALRQGAIDDLKNRGATKIYTFPVTDAGEALAESQGFTDDPQTRGFMSKGV